MDRHTKGQLAEQRVCKFLESKGYTIIAKNYRCIGSELDIIASLNDVIAVVEVKYRNRLPNFTNLEETLPDKKINALIRGINHFISARSIDYQSIRIDFALVYQNVGALNVKYWENISP